VQTAPASVHELKIMHLEKQLIYRKSAYDRQLVIDKTENDALKEKIVHLEKELEAKERLSRVQVIEKNCLSLCIEAYVSFSGRRSQTVTANLQRSLGWEQEAANGQRLLQ
jgi:hypothetical protein